MERNTIKITLPTTKFEVEVYSYITGGEKRQITEIITSGMSSDISGTVKGDIPLTVVYKANDKALELLVKSVARNTEEVLSSISNLPATDYDILLERINAITNNSDYEEKKTN